MNWNSTNLEGCIVLEPKVFLDSRGYFMESFNQKTFDEITQQSIRFVQDNQSLSSKGVLRGLHYQTGEFSQSKLVRVLQGSVLDIAVDIRPGSKTFGQYHSEILTAENQKQVFIPKGFAHGFLVLSDTALFSYKCDQYYNAASEGGILFSDSFLNIDWQFLISDCMISDKDLKLPEFSKARAVW